MAAYTRQSSFSDGDTISASLFNNEYDALAAAFVNTSGHKHDGTTGEGPVIGVLGDASVAVPLNKILIDSSNDHLEFYVDVSSSSVQQLYIADGLIAPVTDSDVDLGTSSLYFKNAYIDSITTTGNVAVGGNLTVTGTTTFNGGTLTLGDADTDNIVFGGEVDSNIIPDDDGTHDLGSSTKEWKDIYIDGIIPTVGNVIDGLGENDLDFSSSLSELSFNWIGFNDNTSSGIKKFMIGIGSSPGEIDVQSFVDVGINRNHTFSNLDLYNGSTYFAIVKVEDKAGNSAAAVSNGVTIDQFPGAPQVVGYFYPGEDYQLPNNYSSELSIEFSEPINDIVISISSPIGSMAFDTKWQESKTKLVYSFTSPIPSFSQLEVSLTNITDFAGIKGDNFAITYNTAALADYNFDSSVDGLDLANFISSWNNNDLSYELGPAIGTVPNLIVTPDGRFDLEDIMGFTRMWHWSRKNVILGKILSEQGQRLIYDLDGQNLKFDWIEGASVGQFDFEYDPTMLTLKRLNESKDNNYKLSYVDTLRGYSSFAFVNSNPSQFLSPAFSFDISSRESKSINLNYQFYDDFGSLMAQGSELITLKPIPSEFAFKMTLSLSSFSSEHISEILGSTAGSLFS